jgi:hypothetical protein
MLAPACVLLVCCLLKCNWTVLGSALPVRMHMGVELSVTPLGHHGIFCLPKYVHRRCVEGRFGCGGGTLPKLAVLSQRPSIEVAA